MLLPCTVRTISPHAVGLALSPPQLTRRVTQFVAAATTLPSLRACTQHPARGSAAPTMTDPAGTRSVGRKRQQENGSNGAAPAPPARTPHYEWMGPPGALFIMTSLPLVIYALYFLCEPARCIDLAHAPWQSAHRTATRPLTAARSLLSARLGSQHLMHEPRLTRRCHPLCDVLT